MNRNRNASANSIGGSNVSEPFHIVAVQLNTFTPVGTAMSIVDSMKNSCAGERHADREHVVRPHDERQEGDRGGRVHHRLVAEQRLARERRDDLRDDAEGRQDQDVHLGVPEEPEDVLEHHRVAAAGRGEERRAEEVIGEQHRHRAREHRHHRDQQVRGDQPASRRTAACAAASCPARACS